MSKRRFIWEYAWQLKTIPLSTRKWINKFVIYSYCEKSPNNKKKSDSWLIQHECNTKTLNWAKETIYKKNEYFKIAFILILGTGETNYGNRNQKILPLVGIRVVELTGNLYKTTF